MINVLAFGGHCEVWIKYRCGIDAQPWPICGGGQTGVAVIELEMRMTIKRIRSPWPTNLSDSHSITFITELKVGNVKYREGDIRQLAEPRIVKSHCRISLSRR